MSEVVWEEPPPAGRGHKGVWAERLAPLRERPGVWGRLPGTFSKQTVYQLRNGEFSGVDPEAWEFACRPAGQGRGVIYARFMEPF